jgi:erythromycin esterase
MRRCACHFLLLFTTLFFANQGFSQDTTAVVSAWLKQHALPLKTIEPGNGFSDLQPLKETWKDLRAIGLGEATHGTHEFFRVRHRLIEFLVTQLGFTDFIIEAPYSACQPINDYILTGKGDRATVLTGQGYIGWDTEEFSALVDWMRTYNKKAADEKKIRFYGMDIAYNGVGRGVVLDYLRRHAPQQVAATDSLFQTLAAEEGKWPTRLNQRTLQSTFMPLQQLRTFLATNKEKLIAASAADTWENVSKYTDVMQQWVEANIEDTTLSFLPKPKRGRDEYMLENVRYFVNKAQPSTKFMVWAHHLHIAANNQRGMSIGTFLRERLGNSYYALDVDCNLGTFQTRLVQSDGQLGELKADTIPPGHKQSFSWYLANVGKSPFFVDFRSAQADPIISKWLETPKEITWSGWINASDQNNQPMAYREVVTIKGFFDGVVFIEHSTPTHPTKNAVARSKNNLGL